MDLLLIPSLVQQSTKSSQQEATLVVFKSGDFLVLPSQKRMNYARQVFTAKRNKVTFNLKFCRLSRLHLSKSFMFLATLWAWLIRKSWRLSPVSATQFRQLLVDNGFCLLYVKDDTYRVSFFRSNKYKLKFWRKLPQLTFMSAKMDRLNHVNYSGLNIYFNEK